MKALRTLALVSSFAFAPSAFAATVNLAAPTGIMDLVPDGTNNASLGAICGSNTLAALFSTCQSQLIVTSLGEGLVKVNNVNPNGHAASSASSPVTLGTDGAQLAPGGQTGTTAITVLAASGSGAQHEYMTGLQIGRSDAGTTAITAAVTDGTLTLTYVVPNSGGGGGNNINFATPFQWALNHAVTCTASSGVTTFYCYAQGFNAP